VTVGAYWARNLADGGNRWHEVSQPVIREFRRHARSVHDCRGYEGAPPAGFEPAHTAPEADALSPELWGLRDVGKATSRRPFADTQPRHATGHTPGTRPGTRRAHSQPPARTGRKEVRREATLTRVTQELGRVLVVDDDEVIRRLIEVNLSLEGFDVSTAVDGQDCLDKVMEINPDVITLDVMMPRLDGWETAVQLREAPDTAHIKVVLISARAQEADKLRGTRVGADAYLTKPFDPNEMIRLVRELVGPR
jgi:CheY-like chemotaxis protein